MKKFIYFLTLFFSLTFLIEGGASAQTKTHKKHWSHRKKDAVVGASAGAVTGAVVSRHHVKGAVIGSAIGAGTGYVVGKKKDKKTTKTTKKNY